MLIALWNLFFFVVALGVLVTIHEFGHFWVARRAGVFVERFSIGFGPPLWRRQGSDGTEYVIAAIPLGGYVKMLDERVAEVPAERAHQAFNNKSLRARSAIVAAGPAANMVFAVLVYWLMWMVGVPAVKPVIGSVSAHSIAAAAGLKANSEITAVGDRQTRSWDDVNLALVGHIGEPRITLTTKDKRGVSHRYQLDSRHWQFDPDKQSSVGSLGIKPFRPGATTTLARVSKDSAAAKAGLQAGDRIVAYNGQVVNDWSSLVSAWQQHPAEPLLLTVVRQGERKSFTVVPQLRDGHGYLGVSPQVSPWPPGMLTEIRYGPIAALQEGVSRTWQVTSLTLSTLAKLVTGELSLSNLSGPVAIAQGAGASAGIGFAYFLGFLGLISVNLGIINLLPLPVLDGGHLSFFLYEAIRGKPLSERAQEMGFRIGTALLLMLMGIAIFNDLARL